MDGRDGVAVDAAVLEPACTFDLAALPYLDVLDVARVDDDGARTDGAHGGCHRRDIVADETAHPADKLGPVAVERHDIGLLGGEAVIDGDLAASGLVQDRDLDAVAERRLAVADDDIDIFDESIVPDAVIGNIIVDTLDAAVVTDLDVVQGDVVQSGMLFHASRKLELLVKGPEPDVTRKTGGNDVVRGKTVRDHDTSPFGGLAQLPFKLSDLFGRKISIGHCQDIFFAS